MSIFAVLMLSIHYLLVSVLCIYGAHRIYHSLVAKRLIGDLMDNQITEQGGESYRPTVTVQIPLFNEKFVAARIIDHVAAFQYPIDKLHIQVIDDSTDECSVIVAERVRHYKALGYDIEHIQRVDREGYKAGALAAVMDDVKGEFIAIFDADFVPETDFLLKTLPYFKDKKVGLVQSRWSYLNSNVNTLTRLQTLMLDAHFGIEQVARSGQGVFFNFNGTAGVWRKETIIDAGGWNSDTLTEDTDLSYRAQMRGWEFIYRPEIQSPSEIPESMMAFKVQQHRWAKGTIEVMRKILPEILKSKISLRNKIEATLHLTANITYLLMFVDSLFFLLPAVHIRQEMGAGLLTWLDLPIFAFASLSHAYFFMSGQKRLYGRVMDKIFILPALLATSIGLGVNNGRAVIEALIGYKTGFVRTPKVGSKLEKATLNNAYKTHSETLSTRLEFALGLIYTGFLIWAIYQSYWIVIPFLSLFAVGFFYISILSLKETSVRKTPVRKTPVRKTLSAPKTAPQPEVQDSLVSAE